MWSQWNRRCGLNSLPLPKVSFFTSQKHKVKPIFLRKKEKFFIPEVEKN
jgi:hypothetical protein